MGVKGPADQAFLPHFDPYIPVDESGFYPYLLAPVEQFKLVATALGNAPYLTKMLDDVTLEETDLVVHVHPETAHERHLKNMDRAKIKTAKGDITVRVHLFEGARPGVIFAPVGLGHTGFGYYLRGKGANPMEIVTAAADPLSGQALWWGTPANLTKA
jgi:anaerobic selenocysteine-containing dehydrogenase